LPEQKYQWLVDVGMSSAYDVPALLQGLHFQTKNLEEKLWKIWSDDGERPLVSPDGTLGPLSWPYGMSGHRKELFLKYLPLHTVSRNKFLAALGTATLEDPTVEGRTWLVPWSVTRDLELRTAIQSEAALVVAPVGMFLQRDAGVMVRKAWDLGEFDAEVDTFFTKISGDPLLLSNSQRFRWGRGMHALGRVYWVLDPPKVPKKPRLKRLEK
jgi:hypothetical protein